MRRHLQERHPSWETNISSTELKIFSDSISISNDEEIRLGIPESFHGRSIIANEVYDNRRLNALPTIHDTHGDSPQRTRQRIPDYTTIPPAFNLSNYAAAAPLSTNSYTVFNDVFR
jgi:hypothetical protein